ncbi:MAG: hypothetical protein KDB07_11965, partial [Planctomycetes bacterium]|nr:hypothetical protein [Planctomycetota bacterium]
SVEGKLSVPLVEQLLEARRFNDLGDELRRLVSNWLKDNDKFNFGDEALLKALINVAACQDRPCAGAALEMLAIGAQQLGKDEMSTKALETIKTRIETDREATTSEQYNLLIKAATALRYLQSKEGALTLLDFLDERFNTMFAKYKKRIGRQSDFKDFWTRSLPQVPRSFKGLEVDAYAVPDVVVSLSSLAQDLEGDYKAWSAKVRTFLNGQ